MTVKGKKSRSTMGREKVIQKGRLKKLSSVREKANPTKIGGRTELRGVGVLAVI